MTPAKSSSRRSRAAALVVALATLAPGIARAGDADGKTLFAEGRELRMAGRCAEAIERFRLALEALPAGLGALRNAAECEEEIGRFASARRDYWDLRRAALKSSDPKYRGWDEYAAEAHRRLETKVARVIIEIVTVDPVGTPVSAPPLDRMSVTLDGQPLNPKLLGTELERDLGSLVVEARYGAATGVSRSLELGEGAHETVRLELPMPATEPPAATEAKGGGLSSTQVGGIVSLSVAAALGGGALGAVAIRQSAVGALEEACPAYRTSICPAGVADDVDRGRTASTLVNVFVGVGAAAALAGIVLVALPADDGSEQAPAASLGLDWLPAGAGARVAWEF